MTWHCTLSLHRALMKCPQHMNKKLWGWVGEGVCGILSIIFLIWPFSKPSCASHWNWGLLVFSIKHKYSAKDGKLHVINYINYINYTNLQQWHCHHHPGTEHEYWRSGPSLSSMVIHLLSAPVLLLSDLENHNATVPCTTFQIYAAFSLLHETCHQQTDPRDWNMKACINVNKNTL